MVVTLLDQLSGFGEQHFMLSELFETGAKLFRRAILVKRGNINMAITYMKLF